MINLSQLARQSSSIPLGMRIKECFSPETYLAENVADYKAVRESLAPSWFKNNEFLHAGHYALVIFYNIGIDAIYDRKVMERKYAKIHDASAQFVTIWTGPGDIFPAEKEYAQFLEDGDLKPQDFVYRMMVRHSYLGKTSYVVSIEKDNFTKRQPKKETLADKISSFFPDLVPNFKPI